MPSADTFSIPPIEWFVKSYLMQSKCSVDPFARNKRWATYTNDLNPETSALYHMDAWEFLHMLATRDEVKADLLLFDPPYSPRQISECYQSVGKVVKTKDTQSAFLYKECRDEAMALLSDDAVVLSFGWNSVGMGKERGFEIVEILLICHGGGHNDTICIAERRMPKIPELHFDELRNG